MSHIILLFLQGIKFSARCFTNRVKICWSFQLWGVEKTDQSPLHVVLLSGVRLICTFPKVSLKILCIIKAEKEYHYPGDDNK